MKRFISLSIVCVFLVSSLVAGGPTFRHRDPIIEQEFEDVYREISGARSTISNWTSFTPTGSWSTNITYTGRWRRVGDTLEVEFMGSLSGAPNSTALTINLPNGMVIDTNKLSSAGGNTYLGSGLLEDAGNSLAPCVVIYSNTTSVSIRYHGENGTFVVANGIGDNVTPFTWGSGDKISGRYAVPISGWTFKN